MHSVTCIVHVACIQRCTSEMSESRQSGDCGLLFFVSYMSPVLCSDQAISSYFGGNNIRDRTLLCLQTVGFTQINTDGVLLYCLYIWYCKVHNYTYFKFEVLFRMNTVYSPISR